MYMGASRSTIDTTNSYSEKYGKCISTDDGKVITGISSYDLLCLGVGKGATNVYSNQASSSFALLRRSTAECVLLIDIGLGTIYALQKYLQDPNARPRQVFISHNHTDHSGELPVFIANEGLKSRVRIYCFKDIKDRLKDFRCAELNSSTVDLLKNVDWIECHESEDVELDSGDPNSNLKLRIQKSQHSELCAGFVLFENNQPILSFSGDSGFDALFYTFLWTAPTILIDGRKESSYEHASFDEILNFYKKAAAQRRVFVYHYGLESEKPQFPPGTILAVLPGQGMQLMLH